MSYTDVLSFSIPAFQLLLSLPSQNNSFLLQFQNEWVNNFYKQNGYLEYDSLIRLGITDYNTYLRKQVANEETFSLNSCIVSKRIIEQLDAAIDECISSKSYLDVQTNLPSVFNENDIKMVLDIVLTKQKQLQTVVVANYVLSKTYIEDIAKGLEDILKEKAKNLVESGAYQRYITELQVPTTRTQKFDQEIEETKVDKREERKKKSNNKASGGSHGREIKTKAQKKPLRGKNNSESGDSEVSVKKTTLQVLTEDDIKNTVHSKLEEEGLDELTDDLVDYLLPNLNAKGLEQAAAIYASTVSDRTANRRQTHNDLQNKLNVLIGDVRLFEKGIKTLPTDLQPPLYKYLLKTLCTDIVNEILNYVAAEQGSSLNSDGLTNEQRLKFVNDLPVEYKKLSVLVKSLLGQNIDEFMTAVEESLATCSMILKKIDKKKDRVLVLNHKHELLEQMNKCDDPALVLHLAVLVIFITATQTMLHASGRHVTSILGFLKQFLSAEQLAELTTFHGESHPHILECRENIWHRC